MGLRDSIRKRINPYSARCDPESKIRFEIDTAKYPVPDSGASELRYRAYSPSGGARDGDKLVRHTELADYRAAMTGHRSNESKREEEEDDELANALAKDAEEKEDVLSQAFESRRLDRGAWADGGSDKMFMPPVQRPKDAMHDAPEKLQYSEASSHGDWHLTHHQTAMHDASYGEARNAMEWQFTQQRPTMQYTAYSPDFPVQHIHHHHHYGPPTRAADALYDDRKCDSRLESTMVGAHAKGPKAPQLGGGKVYTGW